MTTSHNQFFKIRELIGFKQGPIKTLCSKCVEDTTATKCMVEFVGSDFTDDELKNLTCANCGATKDKTNGQL